MSRNMSSLCRRECVGSFCGVLLLGSMVLYLHWQTGGTILFQPATKFQEVLTKDADLIIPSGHVQHVIPEEGSLVTINPFAQLAAPKQHIPPVCSNKVTNIYYVKVHKTASSTMITLLYKFYRQHGLTVYPVTGDPYPGDISKSTFAPPPARKGMQYNFFGEHAMFNADAAEKRMPKDTIYIATIRYPIAHLRSLFVEFGITHKLKIKSADPISTFLLNLKQYQGRVTNTKNFQAKTMGLEAGQTAVDFLKWTKKKFSAIIIAEYFDESLIAMRRQFCWHVEDIVYTVLRARTYKSKNVIPTQKLLEIHRNYSDIDYLMYDFYVNQLMTHIGQEEGFWDEFYLFKNIKENIFIFCDDIVSQLKANSNVIYKLVQDDVHEEFDPSPWGHPFNVTAVDCAMMKLRTRVHRNLMKIVQFPELCEFKNDDTGVIHRDIKWIGPGQSKLQMSQKYCSRRDAKSNIPLAVLALHDSYMWIG